MHMKQIFSDNAPKAIGPYCHAIAAGNMVFCSGQIPLDPGTMQIKGKNITEQTRQVMDNLKTVLEAAGSGLDKIVKTTVFLDNIDDFTAMNDMYEKKLGGHKPARSAFEVGRLPKGALVEIECIALIK